jgi:hypothetical protein
MTAQVGQSQLENDVATWNDEMPQQMKELVKEYKASFLEREAVSQRLERARCRLVQALGICHKEECERPYCAPATIEKCPFIQIERKIYEEMKEELNYSGT